MIKAASQVIVSMTPDLKWRGIVVRTNKKKGMYVIAKGASMWIEENKLSFEKQHKQKQSMRYYFEQLDPQIEFIN